MSEVHSNYNTGDLYNPNFGNPVDDYLDYEYHNVHNTMETTPSDGDDVSVNIDDFTEIIEGSCDCFGNSFDNPSNNINGATDDSDDSDYSLDNIFDKYGSDDTTDSIDDSINSTNDSSYSLDNIFDKYGSDESIDSIDDSINSTNKSNDFTDDPNDPDYELNKREESIYKFDNPPYSISNITNVPEDLEVSTDIDNVYASNEYASNEYASNEYIGGSNIKNKKNGDDNKKNGDDKKKNWVNINDYRCDYNVSDEREVYNKFQTALLNGKHPVQKPEIILATGVPGSFKTTYIIDNYKGKNYVILDIDYLFYNIGKIKDLMSKEIVPVYPQNAKCLKLAKYILDKLLRYCVDHSYNIVVDHPFLHGNHILMAKDKNYKIGVIFFHNNNHELSRNSRYEKTGQSKKIKKEFSKIIRNRLLLFHNLIDSLQFILNGKEQKLNKDYEDIKTTIDKLKNFR